MHTIKIDAGRPVGPLNRIWTYLGMDELNWVYTRNGLELLDKIRHFMEKPYYLRVHNMFTSGNGIGMPKIGTTNVYREDENGNPVYEWRILDRLFDALVERGIRPFIEFGFMPEDLMAANDAPAYLQYWYHQNIPAGCTYPPREYERWYELVRKTVERYRDRYGIAELRTWYWEVWNEPDILYWSGTTEEYCKLYDYAVKAVKEIDGELRVGGPSVANGGLDCFEQFLEHCAHGTNFATGEPGSPLDFISFHPKAGPCPRSLDPPKVTPRIARIDEIMNRFQEILVKYPQFSEVELQLTECDTDGMGTRGISDNPNLHFRNTTYYPSFVMAMTNHLLGRNLDGTNPIRGMLTWAFQVEGMPYFHGIRQLSTNGIDKPILNLFRMLSHLGDTRLEVTGCAGTYVGNYYSELNAIATTTDDGRIAAVVWNHHDDWDVHESRDVTLTVRGLRTTTGAVRVTEYRIDSSHSNACTVYQAMGSPDIPTEEQIDLLKSRAGLEQHGQPWIAKVTDGSLSHTMNLETHGLSLFIVETAGLS